jgi:UDP-N-acetylglucosamine--N-acetylmuramyl-(pentapeptide) pyrophosphoryl-undecaprenol N-acetylglucosamine transferase
MKIIFAGGGTGGHLFPAIAIAQEILKQQSDAQIAFAGTEKGIEFTEVQKQGFPLHLVPAAAFKRGFSARALFDNLKFPFRVWESINEAKVLLDQEEPDVVVGTGGFVSFPVVWAAQSFGIPTLIQEQNSKPGWATRTLARKADEVHLAFDSSKTFFSSGIKTVVSGNPTRRFERIKTNEARQFFGLNPLRQTLFVFGGSLGARSLNTFVESNLDALLREANVIWQTGKTNYADIEKRIGKKENLWYSAFIDRMDYGYAAADLVMCRAGASTLGELTSLGAASVLVPYPFAADNHQYFNAKALADKNAALLIEDAKLAASFETVKSLLNDDVKQSAMKSECVKLGKPNAAAAIAARVIQLASDGIETLRE